MMAINFPAAAFLAGLKVPSQIMYCISQDTGAPVVVYKDSHNVQQSINVPPWSGAAPDGAYNGHHQPKEIQQVNISASSTVNQQQSTIRVEAGNQVNFFIQRIKRIFKSPSILGRNNSNSTNPSVVTIQHRLPNPTRLILFTSSVNHSSTGWLHSSSWTSIRNSASRKTQTRITAKSSDNCHHSTRLQSNC